MSSDASFTLPKKVMPLLALLGLLLGAIALNVSYTHFLGQISEPTPMTQQYCSQLGCIWNSQDGSCGCYGICLYNQESVANGATITCGDNACTPSPYGGCRDMIGCRRPATAAEAEYYAFQGYSVSAGDTIEFTACDPYAHRAFAFQYEAWMTYPWTNRLGWRHIVNKLNTDTPLTSVPDMLSHQLVCADDVRKSATPGFGRGACAVKAGKPYAFLLDGEQCASDSDCYQGSDIPGDRPYISRCLPGGSGMDADLTGEYKTCQADVNTAGTAGGDSGGLTGTEGGDGGEDPPPCADADEDGTCDADDGCPNNPAKIQPGPCGCIDGQIDKGEQCDGGANCTDQCTCLTGYEPTGTGGCRLKCGNKKIDAGEECDGELNCTAQCICEPEYEWDVRTKTCAPTNCTTCDHVCISKYAGKAQELADCRLACVNEWHEELNPDKGVGVCSVVCEAGNSVDGKNLCPDGRHCCAGGGCRKGDDGTYFCDKPISDGGDSGTTGGPSNITTNGGPVGEPIGGDSGTTGGGDTGGDTGEDTDEEDSPPDGDDDPPNLCLTDQSVCLNKCLCDNQKKKTQAEIFLEVSSCVPAGNVTDCAEERAYQSELDWLAANGDQYCTDYCSGVCNPFMENGCSSCASCQNECQCEADQERAEILQQAKDMMTGPDTFPNTWYENAIAANERRKNSCLNSCGPVVGGSSSSSSSSSLSSPSSKTSSSGKGNTSSQSSLAYHYACMDLACTLILSEGEDSCATDEDCVAAINSSSSSFVHSISSIFSSGLSSSVQTSGSIANNGSSSSTVVAFFSASVTSDISNTAGDQGGDSGTGGGNGANGDQGGDSGTGGGNGANGDQGGADNGGIGGGASSTKTSNDPYPDTPYYTYIGNSSSKGYLMDTSSTASDDAGSQFSIRPSSYVPTTTETYVAAASVCGNGVIEGREECDDSNRRDNDGCNSTCLLEVGVCGDGRVQTLLGEQCESSTHDSLLPYACERCRYVSASCGDGVPDPGEECDDGTLNASVADARCRPDCSLGRCGDGVVDTGELCDDGNKKSGDGCSANCLDEVVPTSVLAQFTNSAMSSSQAYVQQNPWQYAQFPQYPVMPTGQSISYQLPLAQLQPLIQGQAPIGDTGPAVVAVIGAGAAAGFSWMRKRRK